MLIPNRLSRAVSLTATDVLLASALAACSGSDKSEGNSSADEIVLGTSQPLSSTVYTNQQPEYGMRAAIKAINADGGINGCEVKLKVCDTAFDANKEMSCARDLISEGVSAIMSPTVMVDQTGRPHALADKAGVSMISARGLDLADLQCPISFPTTAGQAGWSYGSVGNLVKAGTLKIGLIANPSPSAAPANIEALGKDAEGILLSSYVDSVANTANLEIERFIDEVEASDSDIVVDEPTLTGIIPSYQVKGNTPPLKDEPRMFNHLIKPLVVEGGTYKSEGDFFDPFAELASLSN